MDIQDSPQPAERTPSLQELANIMELNFDEQDPVTSQQQFGDDEFMDPDAEYSYATSAIEDDDTFFDDEFNPEKNRTIVSLQNSGFAKAAVVVGGSFAVISGGAMLFQSQLPKPQVAQEVKTKQPQDQALSTAQEKVAVAQQSESAAKAQLALAKQKDSLAQAHGTSTNSNSTVASNPQGQSTAMSPKSTTSLTPVAVAPSARRVSIGSVARPVIVAPPATNPIAQAPLRPTRRATIAPFTQPVAIAPIPTIPHRQTRRQNLVATNNLIAAVAQPTRPPKPQVNRAATLANQPVVSRAKPGLVQTATGSVLAANMASAANNHNPFSNPMRRTANNAEVAKPAVTGRSLRDYFQSQSVASNVPIPGMPPTEAPVRAAEPPQPQPQQVTVPGRGNVAKKISIASRKAAVRDKILQQVAWSLPQEASHPIPSNLPNELPETAQGTSSLAAGIQLAQSLLPSAPVGTWPELSSSANGTRPSFYNSRIIAGKAGGQKDESEKAEGIALNTPAENANVLPSAHMAKSILVGTSAKGTTVTPILWNAGSSSAAKFILKLEEPIRDNTNQIAIPAGTQLVVVVKPSGTNIGFAELEVVAVIIQGQEFTPPVGMLTVRDDQNGLLVGEDYFRRNEQIASRDSLTVLAGALGRVGQVLNQPTSTISSIGIGSSTTVTNQTPNILGAILEGGFQSLPATWSQRNQQALQEIANKPNVYTIPKDRSVRIFVNQTMEF